jgi:outer membrane protein OmpA-like peptidoglycan-associated protein
MMAHGKASLVALAALTLVSGGCVSMPFFAKEEAEVDARFRGVERRADDHEQRITTLETSAVQTTELAREARDRADLALARTVFGRRSSPAGLAGELRDRGDARALLATVHVLFGFNSSDLDDRAHKALLSIIDELRDNPGLTVDLRGSTDSKGSRAYNVQLAQRRVEAVRRYLLGRGVLGLRILQSSAVGPLKDASVPESERRRVTVKLMKLAE